MLQLASVCSHNSHSKSKHVENLRSLRFSFFGLKNQIFSFCVCSGIGVAQLWEAILKICSFFPRKRNFFFKFMQSLMRTCPQFYDYGKYALRFEVFKSENEKVWNDAPKNYATFCNQQLQLLKKCCEIKNPNLWLQREVNSETEIYQAFLLILLSEALKVEFRNYIKFSQNI